MLLAGRAEPGMSHSPPLLADRGERQRRPPTLAAQIVGELVGGDREQVALQRPPRVVVRQAREKADERLLHDVFAGGPLPQPAFDERQQPSFVLGNQRIPRLRLAGADLLDQEHVGMKRIGHGRKHGAGSTEQGVGGREFSLTAPCSLFRAPCFQPAAKLSRPSIPIIAAGTPRNNRFV